MDAPSPRAAADGWSDALEQPLLSLEAALNALGDALVRRDSAAIEAQAAQLHQALAVAVQRFADAAREGRVPPELRHRLVTASGRVAAQRESLARATAALDRALDVLMPPEPGAGYGADGRTERKPRLSGSLQA